MSTGETQMDRYLYILHCENVPGMEHHAGKWANQLHDAQPYTPDGPFDTKRDALQHGRKDCELMGWEAGSYCVSVDE